MSSTPEAHTQIAGYLLSEFGGETRILSQSYHDGLSVNVLVSTDPEADNPLTCSTIGLSDQELVLDDEAMGFGVELCGALFADETPFVAMLADIAHEVRSGEWTIVLHTILPDVVQPYFPGSTMRHLLLVHPFCWDEDFGIFDPGARHRAVWLQVVPISEAEYRLANEEGVEALEERLESSGVDVFDLLRQSVV